jgi:hypothetical protein
MGYRVEVFDRNLKRVGEIDEWISLDFTVRFCQEGIWQILIKDGTPQAALIEKGGGIVIWQDGVPDPLLSGQVDTYQKYWTKLQHTGPGSLYIAGKCHNRLAYSRLAFPEPSLPVSKQYTGRSTRAVSAQAGSAIWGELNSAFGPSALLNRRVASASLGANPALGDAVTDSLRYDVIGSKLEDWCKAKNVGYRLIYNAATQQVDLKVFAPTDKSREIRFSPELGNLREYIYTLSGPKVTRVVVACQGEGKERFVWQKIDTESEAEWGMSPEQFVDRRDIPLKTGAGDLPVLVTTTGTDGIEDIGQNPDGADWTPDLVSKRSAMVAADAEVAAAEQQLANANTDPEKAAANARLAAARSAQTTAKNNLIAAITAAKPTAVAYHMSVIEEAADSALKDGEKAGNFQVYPIDTADCLFGRDYFVGDVVTVAVDGTEHSDVVREVTISVDDGGNAMDVSPKIGAQGSGEPLNLYKTVYDMQKKLRKLEARM